MKMIVVLCKHIIYKKLGRICDDEFVVENCFGTEILFDVICSSSTLVITASFAYSGV